MKKQKKVKEKKPKKQLPREVGSSLFTFIVILVTLGITLPLHFIFPEALTTYWVIAICVAVISPFVLVNAKINFEATGNFTEEQKKAATTKLGIAMLSIWYADFAFVCMFMNWLVAFFILAGLYLIKMVYNVASVLVNRKDPKAYPNFLIVGDFVLSFLLMILLIYKIPNQSLQTIVTALAAALIGGLLTLLGVIMTIKKSDKDRKEERLNQIKPFFYYTPYFDGPEYHNSKKTNHDKQFQIGAKHTHGVALGRFVNSDKVEFLLKSILIGDQEILCSFDPAISKGELFEICLLSEEKVEAPSEYTLKIEDIDKNEILIRISLDTTKGENVPSNIEFLK
jgi:hypothetical protein